MPRSQANCSCGGFSLETKNVRRRLCNSSGAGCIGLRSVLLAGAFDVTAAEVARYEHIPLDTAKTRIRQAR